MKNQTLLVGALMALASSPVANAAAPNRADFQEYVLGVASRVNASEGVWRNELLPQPEAAQHRVVTETDKSVGPISYWGSLSSKTGEEWMYSCEYKYENIGTEYELYTITSAFITIYDADFKVYRKLTANFELGEHETSINSVQVSPILTKKFFNINEDYEVMVYVHATTDDYTGHSYMQVYTLKDGSLITTMEGDCIGAIDTATDPWGEKYILTFMREEYEISEDNYGYYLHFDIYSQAGWSTGCTLEHTFDIDYALIAGAGNYALPILMNKWNNKIYYALPYYEKPYFVEDMSDEITPDNNFIIDLYDNTFTKIKTTKIPIELEDNALYSFPGLGVLNGNDDMCFGVYNDSEYPAYVVGSENYISETDDFQTSLYVYDADGNRIKTIIKNADDYLRMSDVPGQEQQFCFYFNNLDGGDFYFVNLPSCTEAAVIPLALDGESISTSIDRVAQGNTYKYISSLTTGIIDEEENVIHRFAWYNADGSFEKYTPINLGKDVIMALPYVSADAFDPYLFDTKDTYDFMFLVKETLNDGTTRSKECLRIFSEDSEMLMNLEPIAETGEYLSSIFLMNVNTPKPKLVAAYSGPEGYTLRYYELPLTRFSAGTGTKEDPYHITTAGDLHLIEQAPSACYVIDNDINMGYTPWSGNNCTFTGTIDGQGHTLSNLALNGGSGMFGIIGNGATVRNFSINGVKMTVTQDSGILAEIISGGESSGSMVSNIHVSDVEVTGDSDVYFGGLTGEINLFSTIADCSVTDARINVGHRAVAGGIAGKLATSSTVRNCLFEGTIEAGIVGGIAGESGRGDETIKDCHVNAQVIGYEVAGGIIGYSARNFINNCYVEGSVEAVGQRQAYAGGIAGEVKSLYGDANGMIIQYCVVSAQVSANKESQQAIAHRIAGFTSGDEMLVDWESKDPGIDWSDPSTYPYYPGPKEGWFAQNYALGIDVIDTEVSDDPYSTEGQTIKAEEMTDQWLTDNSWKLGENAAAPWKRGGHALVLYYEKFGLTVDKAEAIVTAEAPLYITFTTDNRYADLITVTSSDNAIATIKETAVTGNGYSVTCEVVYVADGVCTISATLGDLTVECSVTSKLSGMADVIAPASSLVYDGNSVNGKGQICIFNVSGRLMATGMDSVSTQHLAPGVYIAVCDGGTVKFSKGKR